MAGAGQATTTGDGQLELDAETQRLIVEQLTAPTPRSPAEAPRTETPAPHSRPLEGAVELSSRTGLVAEIDARSLVAQGAGELRAAIAPELDAGARSVQ